MTLLEQQLEASVRAKHIEANRALTVVAPAHHVALTDKALQFTPEQKAMIRDTCANGASEEEFGVLLEIAKTRRLNPLLRQIHFVKRWDKDKNRFVWSAQTSIDGLRAVAERTGLYDGQDEPEYGPKNQRGFPEFAKVRVYRKGWARPAVGVAYWAEFVQLKDGHPTKFWANMPHNQLAKCAEALALRKAFPEDCGGLYTDVEMEQASNERGAQQYLPANDSQVVRKPITVHGDDSDEPPLVDPEYANEVYRELCETLKTIEDSLPGCKDYQGALILRDMLGSHAHPSQLTKDIQRAWEGGLLTPSMRGELGKTWMRCNRQLVKLEKDLPPPDAADSFIDDPMS